MENKEVRLIDAELYRKILKSEMFQLDDEHRLDIQRAIILLDQTPATDPESLRPKGKWVVCSDGYYPYCSECKEEPKGGAMTNYCPNCGAVMQGVKDE